MNKFSDFLDTIEKPLCGEKVRIAEILDKSIVVHSFKILKSKFEKDNFSDCAIVQFTEVDSQTKHVFFTGSRVIITTLQRFSEKLPFETVIKKIDKYYTFT
ncbi:MAG: hypothetical protein ACRCZB_05170 [Bacteroidales bacterium]